MGEQSQVNFAIFVSGYGNGAIEIIKNNNHNLIRPNPALLLSSNPESVSLRIAEAHDIPTAVVQRDQYRNRRIFETVILEKLYEHDIDYIFLAGYRLIVGELLLENFHNRIVNIHPSLLPAFKGRDAIGQALEAGVKITGTTTHLIDEKLDEGKILAQRAVQVDEEDDHNSLGNKIFKMGAILTVTTINHYFTTRYRCKVASNAT